MHFVGLFFVIIENARSKKQNFSYMFRFYSLSHFQARCYACEKRKLASGFPSVCVSVSPFVHLSVPPRVSAPFSTGRIFFVTFDNWGLLWRSTCG